MFLASSFQDNLAELGGRMNEILSRLIKPSDGPEHRLQEAMRYACLDGGKRLRPFLVLNSASLAPPSRIARRVNIWSRNPSRCLLDRDKGGPR